MIKHNIKTIKNKINKDGKEDVLKIDLTGYKTSQTETEKMPLNISLVIDCSGSMSAGIDGNFAFSSSPLLAKFKGVEETSDKEFLSKIDMAKKSALQFVETLDEKDFLSLVVFGDNSHVVLESSIMSKENKEKAKNIIKNKINPDKGMTNLYDGWVDGVKEVTNTMRKDALNRVIVLTDGQLNRGETNPEFIKNSVLKMYDAAISTTTFGIGEDFNEDLLQMMSYSGGGNAYYINDRSTFESFIDEEITGITNIAAKNIRLSVEFSKNFSESRLVNDAFEKDEKGYFIVPSLRKEQVQPMIFNLNYSNIKGKKSTKVAVLKVEYTNEDNETVSLEEVITLNVCNQKDWEKLEENKDVLVEKELMEIANLKNKARDFMDQGDILKAKETIQSISQSSLADYDETLYKEEQLKVQSLVSTMDNKDSFGSVRKMMSYQSYDTQRGK